MILPVKAPGPIYLTKINSQSSIDKFLRICLKENTIEKVLLIDPYINDLTLIFLHRLALAEIQPIVIANTKLDKNPLNAQARSYSDIYKKIKATLPRNSYIIEDKDLEEINFLEVIEVEKWLNNEFLILLPFEIKSFQIFSKLMKFKLNGQLNELASCDFSKIENSIKLAKSYQKIIAEQKTLY